MRGLQSMCQMLGIGESALGGNLNNLARGCQYELLRDFKATLHKCLADGNAFRLAVAHLQKSA